MKRGLLVAIFVALILAGVLGAVSCDSGLYPGSTPKAGDVKASTISSQQATGIWVTGQGRVNVAPDVAILSLGVEFQAPTVAEAQGETARAMEAVMRELKAQGVSDKDIKTQRYTISPVKRWHEDKEILLGYLVTNMVSVKIRDVEAAGSIIDAVAAAGGDAIRVNSISFTVDDPASYYSEAREKAMADAQEKAEELADLAHVILGAPVYISEGLGYTPRSSDVRLEVAPAPATQISPGEMEISLTVQVVYGID